MTSASSASVHDAVPSLASDTSALAKNMFQARSPAPLLILGRPRL